MDKAGTGQLSRYGAISKAFPSHIGKTFFLITTTESKNPGTLYSFGVDSDGVARVYTSWAAVIANLTYGDMILVSPQFKTVPTLAQIVSMEATQTITVMNGLVDHYGQHAASLAPTTLPATTSGLLFTVTGKVLLTGLIGTVTTTVQTQTCSAKVTLNGTVGGNTDICATANISAAAVGTTLTITGTLATALQITAGGVLISQQNPVLLAAGSLVLTTGATNTGATKWKALYIPMEPGAFMY